MNWMEKMKHTHKWKLLDKTKGKVQFTHGTSYSRWEDVDFWLVTCEECGEIKTIPAAGQK